MPEGAEGEGQGAPPSPGQILDLVRQWPGISLRQLCALLWPELSWEQASQVGRGGPVPGVPPALWLRASLSELLSSGQVQLAPARREEIGLAGLSYLIPSG
jgi:hypothetical protein